MKHLVITDGEETRITTDEEVPNGFRLLGVHHGKVPPHARWNEKRGKLVDCEATKGHRDRQHRARDAGQLQDRIDQLETALAATERELAQARQATTQLNERVAALELALEGRNDG